MGIIIVGIILLFCLYIYVERQKSYNKSRLAHDRIIDASNRSTQFLSEILVASKAALATDNPNDSDIAANKAIDAYNRLVTMSNQSNVDFLKIKHPEFIPPSKAAIDHIQTQLVKGKARVDDAIKYVISLPNTVFNMARCPVPCYAENPK